MKIRFYGTTQKAAQKKCNTFLNQLMKLENDERSINVTSIGVKEFEGSTDFPIPPAYRVHVFCEYSYVIKAK